MRIFVVEDSAIVRRLIVRRLEAIPSVQVVGEATGQQQALSLIQIARPEVVLVDLTLDSGSGLGLVNELRAMGFMGYIAVLTAQNLDQVRDACISAGADACYEKGTGMETLFGLLEVRARRMNGSELTAADQAAIIETLPTSQ